MINFIVLLLLLLFNFSLEKILYEDFPFNKEFDIINEEKDKNISNIYIGNMMILFKIKTKNKTLTNYTENVTDIRFDFNYLNMTDSKGENMLILCSKCPSNETECNETCIEELSIAYGDFLFIRYIHLPFLFVFFGSFLLFFGRNHYLFGIFFELTGFLYYFVVSCIELFSGFDNNVIPFYILGAAIISGFVFVIFGNAGAKQSLLFEICKIFLGCIIGYFFIKTIFYYISIFTSINNILYLILLLLFIIAGGISEFLLKNILKIDQILFIVSSTLAGSMYIVKGLAYSLGGYYSDTMTSQYGIKYKDDAKLRIIYFLVLHVVLLICSLFYQIKDYKDSLNEDSFSRQNSEMIQNYPVQNKKQRLKSYKDINTDDNDSDCQFKDMSPKDSSSKTGGINLNENEESGDINDQDD